MDNLAPFSMAACISSIIFLYGLLVYFHAGMPFGFSIAILNKPLFLSLVLTVFLVLLIFFRWMDEKGNLFISYFSLLPSLWIISSLTIKKRFAFFPPILQITSYSRFFLLILVSILCFILLFSLFSIGRRLLNKRKGIHLIKPALICISFIFILLLLGLFLRKEDYENNRNEVKVGSIGKPNIVLITMDATRADHLSCYGYPKLTTPNLDKLAKKGVLYKNAYATDSWTVPSHASIFTGMYPTKHGAHRSPIHRDYNSSQSQRGKESSSGELFETEIRKLSDENITLAEILSEKGYRTAGIIGGIMCSSIWGLAQGCNYYDENFPTVAIDIKLFLIYRVVNLFFPLTDFFAQYGYCTKRVASSLNKSAFRWLEKNHGQSFFLFINYIDPHSPYVPPPPYNGYFGKIDRSRILKFNPPGDVSYITALSILGDAVNNKAYGLTPEEKKFMKEFIVSQYDGEICYVDHCLGLLLERLKALKIYDNTLIIVTADHGQAFGEHNQMYHDMTLNEEVLRVPLIIKYPSTFPRPGIVEKRVSLVDLFPTILSLLDYPIPSGIDGEVLENSDHPIIAEHYPDSVKVMKHDKRSRRELKAIYQRKYKYIWASNGLNELYNLEKDPGEEENLIQKLPHKAQEMQRSLNQWLDSSAPSDTKGTVKIDKSTKENLRALGYVR